MNAQEFQGLSRGQRVEYVGESAPRLTYDFAERHNGIVTVIQVLTFREPADWVIFADIGVAPRTTLIAELVPGMRVGNPHSGGIYIITHVYEGTRTSLPYAVGVTTEEITEANKKDWEFVKEIPLARMIHA